MEKDQEELQHLSIISIFHESIAIIAKTSHLFATITLSFILPLSSIFLFNIALSLLLARSITHDEETHNSAVAAATKEQTGFWVVIIIIKAVYLVFVLVLSLLSTSAVVYTVAGQFASKELSFKKLLKVVPKVWKRLVITFLCSFVVLFLYHLVFIGIVVIWILMREEKRAGVMAVLGVVMVVALVGYLVGLVYISVVWQLASVVTVLEDSSGFGAMTKSKRLIKGKVMVSAGIFVVFVLCMVGVRLVFDEFVVMGNGSIGVAWRVVLGGVCLVLICVISLIGLVVQTVVYFVCKSYHHENIDRSSLADHLEVYLGEYVPLKANDIQLGEV